MLHQKVFCSIYPMKMATLGHCTLVQNEIMCSDINLIYLV